MPGSSLSRQEPEHVRSRDLRRRPGHHREEDLQVEGHGKPGVGPGPGSHERQVVIQQRMPEPDHRDAVVSCRADQAWHEFQRVVPFRPGDTPRHAIMSLPLDHPHIKHWHVGTTMRYVTPSATFIEDAYRRAVSGALAELGGAGGEV
jgi:hypothetical protein